MDDDLPLEGEINSELTGLNKGEKNTKKKRIIVAIIFGGLLVVLFVVLITFHTTGIIVNKDILIGEINCIYDVQTKSQNTKIFGNEFKINKNANENFQMYIDGENIKYSKEYQFESIGIHNLQIKLYNDLELNMDYMFKDIKDLISIEMKSENKCKITSMISAFENCENLNNFTLNGYDASELKSMKKLFYKSGISTYSFKSFNTIKLEDISYMFAFSSINELSLSDINTNQVTDISHLLEGCSSILNFNLSSIDTSNVQDISYLFSSLFSIENLDLSNFKTNKIKNMSHLFFDCISLNKINLNNFDTRNVEDMSSMFDGCSSLIIYSLYN